MYKLFNVSDRLDYRALLRVSKDRSNAQSVDLAKKGQRLRKRLDALFKSASELFPSVNLETRRRLQWDEDDIEVCVCEEECDCDDLGSIRLETVPLDDTLAELDPVPLPSSFDKLPVALNRAAGLEKELRVAQAEEALEGLRVDIGHKSFLYLENRDWATGKRERTRGYDRINAVEASMRGRIRKYECARWALTRLGVASEYPQFQPISRADTKAVTAVYDPNKRGDRNAGMSWIWRRYRIEGGSDSDSDSGHEEQGGDSDQGANEKGKRGDYEYLGESELPSSPIYLGCPTDSSRQFTESNGSVHSVALIDGRRK